LLRHDTRLFDCLVGHFSISGFYKLYPALEKIEKIRILIGLQTDRTAFDLLERAREQGQLALNSHASVKDQTPKNLLAEFENSADSTEIEAGVHKFVEWIRSRKLEIKAYPGERLHAKVYIMNFAEGDRDKGRVITGSSNFTQSGLQDNLEFNVELKNGADYDLASAKFNELSFDPTVAATFIFTLTTGRSCQSRTSALVSKRELSRSLIASLPQRNRPQTRISPILSAKSTGWSTTCMAWRKTKSKLRRRSSRSEQSIVF
jgi:hypothetical protein